METATDTHPAVVASPEMIFETPPSAAEAWLSIQAQPVWITIAKSGIPGSSDGCIFRTQKALKTKLQKYRNDYLVSDIIILHGVEWTTAIITGYLE